MDNLTGKCFRCTACGAEFNASPAEGACHICEEFQCHDCMSSDGVCVPCSEVK